MTFLKMGGEFVAAAAMAVVFFGVFAPVAFAMGFLDEEGAARRRAAPRRA